MAKTGLYIKQVENGEVTGHVTTEHDGYTYTTIFKFNEAGALEVTDGETTFYNGLGISSDSYGKCPT